MKKMVSLYYHLTIVPLKTEGYPAKRPKKSPCINLRHAEYRPTSNFPPLSLTAIKQSQAGCKSTGLMFWSRYVDQEQESQKEGKLLTYVDQATSTP